MIDSSAHARQLWLPNISSHGPAMAPIGIMVDAAIIKCLIFIDLPLFENFVYQKTAKGLAVGDFRKSYLTMTPAIFTHMRCYIIAGPPTGYQSGKTYGALLLRRHFCRMPRTCTG